MTHAQDFQRVLFLGNSITLHGPMPSIDWTNNWGMAASAPEKDCVHLIVQGLRKKDGTLPEFLVKNIAGFERQYTTYDTSALVREARMFNPDLILVAIGENVRWLGTDVSKHIKDAGVFNSDQPGGVADAKAKPLSVGEASSQFKDSLVKLLNDIRAERSPAIFVRSCFFTDAAKDAALKRACMKVGGTFVNLGGLDKDKTNLARSERPYKHAGVGGHPGDKGMRMIANAFLGALGRGDAATSSPTCAEIAVAPVPAGEAVCGDYRLAVNGREVPVYACRVSAMPFNQIWPGYQRPLDQTELSGFAYWEMGGDAEIRIDCGTEIKTAVVRPSARGIVPKIDGRRITFSLKKSGPIVVEVNNKHHVLHLFPSEMRKGKVDPAQPGLLYFGPGVHRPGIIRPKSGESVYIDAGAVVYGGILCEAVSNVTISGRGILDAGVLDREDKKMPSLNNLRFNHCRSITVDGIILRDSNNFGCDMRTCKNVTLSNLCLIGFWRYNTDGIDACNCKNVLVRNCFVRSFDDGLVVKGLWPQRQYSTENIRFEGCVVWCDWGNGMEIGASSAGSEMKHIVFTNCDIIDTKGKAISMSHSGNAWLHDVRYENIRVELGDAYDAPRIQKSKDDVFVFGKNTAFYPSLLDLGIRKTIYIENDERGKASDIMFKDIHVQCARQPSSYVSGFDEEHGFKGIRIENLRFNNQAAVTNAAQMKLRIGKFVNDVQFLSAAILPSVGATLYAAGDGNAEIQRAKETVAAVGTNRANSLSLNLFKSDFATMEKIIAPNWTVSDDKKSICNGTYYGITNRFVVDREYALDPEYFIFDFVLTHAGIAYFGSYPSAYRLQPRARSTVYVDLNKGTFGCLKQPEKNDIPLDTMMGTDHFVKINDYEKHIGKKIRCVIKRQKLNGTGITAKLMDMTTGGEIAALLKVPGYLFERPVSFATTTMTLHNISVNTEMSCSNTCFMIIYGDSITEGAGAATAAQAYPYLIASNFGESMCMVSGRSSGILQNVIERISSEATQLRPKYVFVTIGTNGGNTKVLLRKMINSILALGAKPIVNHIPMLSNGQSVIHINTMIDEVIAEYALGEIGCCKYDIATAINHDPRQGQNAALFIGDLVHPNDDGHKAMYLRTKMDCPEIFRSF